MKRILLLTLFLSLNASGQNKVLTSIGVNYPIPFTEEETPLLTDWRLNLNADLRAQIPIMEPVSFRPAISYQYYFFHEYRQRVITGYSSYHSEGTGYQSVKLGGDLFFQVIDSNLFSIPFLFVGGGYAFERPGTRKITWREVSEDGNIYTAEFRDQNRSYWYYGMGIGAEYPLTKKFSVDASFSFYVNKVGHLNLFHTDESFCILNCSVAYELMQF